MESVDQLFWRMVSKGNPDECWLWNGSKNRSGYGQINRNGKGIKAHRYAYMQANKCSIDRKTLVLHKCDNPSCVNPNHLFLGTQEDNMKDMKEKGRADKAKKVKGSSHYKTKLSENSVARIRMMYGVLEGKHIADIYSISRASVCVIQSCKSWNWLTKYKSGWYGL